MRARTISLLVASAIIAGVVGVVVPHVHPPKLPRWEFSGEPTPPEDPANIIVPASPGDVTGHSQTTDRT